MTTTNNDIVRAVLEGVALNTRWALKYVERFCGRKLDPLNFVGGGAQSNGWCQIFADVLDREIRQVQDPIQTNARGAAFIAAVGLGLIEFNDIPNLVRITNTFKPSPPNRALYANLFDEFQAIYKNNKAMYKRLNHANS
jgi:xylulokinase